MRIHLIVYNFFREKYYLFYHFILKSLNDRHILILDDLLPSILSPWRSNEFNQIVEKFNLSYIYSDLSSFYYYNSNLSLKNNLSILEHTYPFLKKRVFFGKSLNFNSFKLGYLIFYNNISRYYNFFHSRNLPFAFTLYPGGGFRLNDIEFIQRLKFICSSPLFKGVIVTQYIVRDFLIENHICNVNRIKLIHGVPLDVEKICMEVTPAKDYSSDLRIVFMANKYTPNGADKGFDLFLNLAKLLIEKEYPVSFDVIGGFSIEDLNNSSILNFFRFHGVLKEKEFSSVLNHTHIIISPNRPFVLHEGAIDGFPLASCVTASLFNNLMVMTDYFEEAEKMGWKNGVDFIKIESNVCSIYESIKPLLFNWEMLKKISFNGNRKVLDHYSYKSQIVPRLKFFSSILEEMS